MTGAAEDQDTQLTLLVSIFWLSTYFWLRALSRSFQPKQTNDLSDSIRESFLVAPGDNCILRCVTCNVWCVMSSLLTGSGEWAVRMEEILCNVWSVTLGENVSIQISGCRTQLRTNKVTTNNNNKTVMTGSPTDSHLLETYQFQADLPPHGGCGLWSVHLRLHPAVRWSEKSSPSQRRCHLAQETPFKA